MTDTRSAAALVAAMVEDGEERLYDGDHAAARGVFAAALAKAEDAYGDRAKELIVPLMGLARASEAMEIELSVQGRALSIAEATLASDDPLLAEVLHAHGISVWASGDPAKGVYLLERALSVARAGRTDPHGYLGPLVGALLDAGRATEAVPVARELLAFEDKSSAPDLTTLFIIGQCFRDAGALDDAKTVFERLLAAFGEDGDPAIRDDIQRWLTALEAETR